MEALPLPLLRVTACSSGLVPLPFQVTMPTGVYICVGKLCKSFLRFHLFKLVCFLGQDGRTCDPTNAFAPASHLRVLHKSARVHVFLYVSIDIYIYIDIYRYTSTCMYACVCMCVWASVCVGLVNNRLRI